VGCPLPPIPGLRGKCYDASTRVDEQYNDIGVWVLHQTFMDSMNMPPSTMNLREKGGMMRVKRINRFRLRVYGEQEDALKSICYMSATLWNELNYIRRQMFFKKCFRWNRGVDELYNSFKMILGSAVTQEIIRKNDEAWRSFFKLKRMIREHRLPPNIKRVRPPGYWKDRNSGKKRLMTVLRCDTYKIIKEGRRKYLIILPRRLGIKIRVTGSFRWHGKQGRLEIYYDELTGRWYGRQSITIIIQPRHTIPPRRAFVDLGIINIIAAWIEDDIQPIAFSGRPLLADWYYWSNKISYYQSIAKKVNGKYATRRIKKLYRMRKRRFRDRINKIVRKFIDICVSKDVSEIVCGDLRGIRDKCGKENGSRKRNKIVNNFWSYRYITNRLKITAENYGIRLKLIDEHSTSSYCPICGVRGRRVYRGLFYCKRCGKKMNADVVGELNIARKYGVKIPKNIRLHPKSIKIREILIQTRK